MEKTMKIEGMMCQNCVKHVMKALTGIPGVTAEVSLEAGTAKVAVPEGVTDQMLTEAVTEAGYEVKEIV